MPKRTIGVVLFQLGGPDSLGAVEPFLRNLFSDPDIIDFPLARFGRPLLARWIAKRRAGKVRKHYREIGGRSPIHELTARQAAALEQELCLTINARVFVAMRYWHPFTAEAVERARQAGCDELVLLPLYPQYSSTTSGSALREWRRRAACAAFSPPAQVIRDFHDFKPYIDALVEQINTSLDEIEESSPVHLLFSAHGVPVSVIRGGDPYQSQVEATLQRVMQRGGWSHPASLCYQSKVGQQEWLGPGLTATVQRLAAEGVEKLLVIPISFVSDHLETLQEIDIEARQDALAAGIRRFEMMPGLNDNPRFIRALAALVQRALADETPTTSWRAADAS